MLLAPLIIACIFRNWLSSDPTMQGRNIFISCVRLATFWRSREARLVCSAAYFSAPSWKSVTPLKLGGSCVSEASSNSTFIFQFAFLSACCSLIQSWYEVGGSAISFEDPLSLESQQLCEPRPLSASPALAAGFARPTSWQC